jgi:hypothetical protein
MARETINLLSGLDASLLPQLQRLSKIISSFNSIQPARPRPAIHPLDRNSPLAASFLFFSNLRHNCASAITPRRTAPHKLSDCDLMSLPDKALHPPVLEMIERSIRREGCNQNGRGTSRKS